MANDGVKVWWCSKTVTGGPWFVNWLTRLGNHHFIMIEVDILGTDGAMPESRFFKKTKKGRYYYLTLSVQDTSMKLYGNGSEDALTVQKWLDDGQRHLRFDLNQVPPPKGTNMAFANKILKIAKKYNSNLESTKVEYDFMTQNCATVVNSLFKAVGVSQSVREDCGEFDQFDWGEEAELPMQLFM